MKKLLLFSACIMLAFASCKKSDPTKSNTTAVGTISATIGGVNETFTTSVVAESVDTPSYTIAISGFRGTGATQEGIQIGISSYKPITTGTYTISSALSNDVVYTPFVGYYKNTSVSSLVTFGTDFSAVHITTIIITSLSSTNVQGTFSGVLINEDGTSTDTQTITDGKFDVNITKANQ